MAVTLLAEIIQSEKIHVMKTSNLIWICVIIICSIFSSCKKNDVQSKILENDVALRAENRHLTTGGQNPGVIPGDIRLMEMKMFPGKYKWTDYYTYLSEEVPKYRDAHFFENLEWLTIASILEDTLFLKTGPLSIKEEVWTAIKDRKVINQPDLVFTFLTSYEPGLPVRDLATRLNHTWKVNEKNFDKNIHAKDHHFSLYKSTYDQMNTRMYDRWGGPLFN
jgi:hypothetical protein